MEKIKFKENKHFSLGTIIGTTLEEVVEKLNEMIDYINKENNE